jgi:protease I
LDRGIVAWKLQRRTKGGFRRMGENNKTDVKTELKDFRVAVIASDGFEEAELIEPVKALRNVGAQVDVISLKTGEIQGFQHLDQAGRVKVDKTIDQVQASDYDGLLLPGGANNADFLRAEAGVLEFVKAFDEAKKPIAAICHAPWILISAGILEERILTSYHTIADDLKNAGAHYVDQQVVVDRNLVTSRQPQDIAAFNREMIKLFGKSRTTLDTEIPESA